MKKIMGLLLVIIVAAGFSGCSNTASTNVKKTKIVWVMPGPGKQSDSEKVWKAFNDELQKYTPGVELELQLFASSDYAQKVMLMQTSRENMDIINTGLLNYGDEIDKGSFLAIDDCIEKYCNELREIYPDYIWDYMKYKGSTYAVPSFQGLATRKGIYTHKELADKYLDGEKFQKALSENLHFTEECYDILEDYLKKLKANNELRLGFKSGAGANYPWKGYETFLDMFCVEEGDEKCIVKYLYQTPEMKLFFEKMADWYKKGYIRKDILSNTKDTTQVGMQDGYISWIATAHEGAEETAKATYGFDISVFPMSDFYIGNTNAGAGGNAIYINSKHPDESVKFLNLINTNKNLYRLLVYGFEGEHYKKLGDEKVETIGYSGNATSSANYGIWGWAVGNVFMGYETHIHPDGYYDYLKEISITTKRRSNLIGFIANTKDMDDKFTQIKTIKTEYSQGLLTGALEDWEKHYDEFMKKLELAGIEEVKQNLQEQINRFLESKNK